MRHFFKFRFGATFGLLFISLVIALSAVELLLSVVSPIDPKPPIKEVVVLNNNATS